MKKIITFLAILCTVAMSNAQLAWSPQNSGTNVVLFDIDFTDHNNGWVCGNSGTVLHTDDGGANWYEQDAPPNNTYYGIDFVSVYTGYVCGYGGRIIHTTDGGINWNTQESNTNTYLYDVFFVDENTGWIVGGDNGTFPSYISYRIILHTTDGGANWIKQVNASDESPLRSLFFVDHNTGYAVSETGEIMHTSDGGTNWIRQADFSSNELRSIFFLDADHGWVVGEYLGLPHEVVILITTDGGVNWAEHYFYEGFSPSDVFFLDEYNGWLVGSGTLPLHYTHDGGYTWAPDDPGVFEVLFSIYFVDESSGWAVGNQGTIISSATAVDIPDKSSANKMNVFPNPVSSSLNIHIEPATSMNIQISLVNSIGQVIFKTQKSVSSGTLHTNIDMEDFPAGIYYLIIDQRKERTIRKVIVRK